MREKRDVRADAVQIVLRLVEPKKRVIGGQSARNGFRDNTRNIPYGLSRNDTSQNMYVRP